MGPRRCGMHEAGLQKSPARTVESALVTSVCIRQQVSRGVHGELATPRSMLHSNATCVPLYVEAMATAAELTLWRIAASVDAPLLGQPQGKQHMKSAHRFTRTVAMWIAASMAAGAVVTISSAAQARAYGSAGCGLGSLIFEPSAGFSQVFAATTNGTSYSQTFGITSGTSNCAGGSSDSAGAKAFVETNRVALAKDIARGRGETIDGLSKLAGCRAPSAVGSSLQRRFDQIFSDVAASDSAVGESVLEALRADSSLACSALISG